jgi:hypothetical protein
MQDHDGIFPMRAVLDLEIGEEVILYLRESTPFVSTLAKTRPFHLRLFGGATVSRFGPLGFLLFWIPSPYAPNKYLYLHDIYINSHNESSLWPWRELSHQTHVHLFLLDKNNRQRDFFEFRNTFRFEEIVDQIATFCRNIPAGDFDKAKAEFISAKFLDDLFADGPTQTTLNEAGISIYDSSLAIPDQSGEPNPLRSARILRAFEQSKARHLGREARNTSSYLDTKLATLQEWIGSRTVIYLDVCHWINLRHVWLQSNKANPIYAKILNRLMILIQRNAILCPLSVPIFQELLKQLDPRSRAATANLMEIFSQGVVIFRFEEAFAAQCRVAVARQGSNINVARRHVCKIGLWFADEEVKSSWWSNEVAEIWDRVSIDLRWELSIADCQRLAYRDLPEFGETIRLLNKWTPLPARQKAIRSSFGDLIRECRRDVVEEYWIRTLSLLQELADPSDRGAEIMSIRTILDEMIESRDYGRIPSCEIVAGMCAAQVYRGGKLKPNDVCDFLHAGLGIPFCSAYFCDGPMEHLAKNSLLSLHEQFGVAVHSKPEDLLSFLDGIANDSGLDSRPPHAGTSDDHA